MILVSKPELNLFAGWKYLLSSSYRQEVKDDWQGQPAWLVAAQVVAGACSIIFPLTVIGLLAYVLLTRHI